ncbi:MAG TPA: MerC family mercury resistance protein [Acidiferrobacterales bacterium]|nr:MerC family mercury resistance protein [Acidiferrobacterales bacterium]
MPTIEFLYDRDCPNVSDARAALRRVLENAGMPLHWQEWERNDPTAPVHARRYGSPTILVDGMDIAGECPSDEPSCRIYAPEPGRHRGVPSMEMIMLALKPRSSVNNANIARRGAGVLAFLPAAGTALLPKLTCPACWPAYAAVLSSLGLGFVDYTPWLLPATAVFIVITLALIAWRPRRGYRPLVLGIGAGAAVLIGKFLFDSEIAVYTGIALLAGASAWNAWPRKAVTSCKC